MNKRLITCPVCGYDQHIYDGKVCNHDGIGAIRCTEAKLPATRRSLVCTGSRMTLEEAYRQATANAVARTKANFPTMLDYDDQIQLLAAERYYNDD